MRVGPYGGFIPVVDETKNEAAICAAVAAPPTHALLAITAVSTSMMTAKGWDIVDPVHCVHRRTPIFHRLDRNNRVVKWTPNKVPMIVKRGRPTLGSSFIRAPTPMVA